MLVLPWLAPGPGTTLGTSWGTPCSVLVLFFPTVPLPPLLGGGPGVWAWLAARVSHGCLGLSDRVVVPVPKAGAVTPVAADSPPPVGLTPSPARHTRHLTPGTSEQSPPSSSHNPVLPGGKKPSNRTALRPQGPQGDPRLALGHSMGCVSQLPASSEGTVSLSACKEGAETSKAGRKPPGGCRPRAGGRA